MNVFNNKKIAEKIGITAQGLRNKINKINGNKLTYELIKKIEIILLNSVANYIKYLKSTLKTPSKT